MLAGATPRHPEPRYFGLAGDDGDMTDAESAKDGGPIQPGDAFAVLGNETRMDVLRTLWEARDPFEPPSENALSFTELRERVGMADPGQFNYHLNELVGRFVRRTEAGYVLRPNATDVLRAVVTGSVTGEEHDLRADATDPCPLCGAAVEVRYSNPTLTVRCTECRGEYLTDVAPEGTLMSSSTFPPHGLGDRSGQELWEALFVHLTINAFGFLRGVCPKCAAPTSTTVEACTDHSDEGMCAECESTQAVVATMYCDTCTAAWRFPAWVTAMTHPDVIGFFDEHGLDADGGITLDVYASFLTAREDVRSTDPPELEVTAAVDGDELAVTIDETLGVTDVRS